MGARRHRLKRGLMVFGTISVITGGSLLLFYDEPEEEPPSIFEEIPQQETKVNTQPVEAEKDTEPVVEVEQGQITRKVIEFSFDEAQVLLKSAQAEAGNQGIEGMWLVMCVEYNRKLSETFPDNIVDVVYQPHQFSSVTNGSIDEVEVSPECHLALARLESGEVSPGIIGFETKKSEELDKYFDRAFEYKDHRFYTEKLK